jgi:hypothetical protein
MTPEEQLAPTYAAFNARDIDQVLAQMTDDVDWPNAWEGGRLVGHVPCVTTGRASGRRSTPRCGRRPSAGCRMEASR